MNRSKLLVFAVPAVIVVILDQLTKFLVRTIPYLQNLEIIPGWLSLYYTQNPGMALGMDWLSTFTISCVAIVATVGIFIYVIKTMDRVKKGYLFCMGLILGGAVGNIIDRIFMGWIQSTGGILEGHVVDFIHFSLEVFEYPVFPYIFNIADVAISTAIISLIVFHKSILPTEDTLEKPDENELTDISAVSGSDISSEKEEL